MSAFTVQDSSVVPQCPFQVIRTEDNVIVGFHFTQESAQACADNDGVPPAASIKPLPPIETEQFDLFGGARP